MSVAALGMQVPAEQPVAHSAVALHVVAPLAFGCSPSMHLEALLAAALPVLLGGGHHPGRSQALVAPELKAQVLT